MKDCNQQGITFVTQIITRGDLYDEGFLYYRIPESKVCLHTLSLNKIRRKEKWDCFVKF